MAKVVTYSEYACYARCPRQHWLRYDRRLEPKMPSRYFEEGKAGHAAFETFYRGGTIAEAMRAFQGFADSFFQRLTELGEPLDEYQHKIAGLAGVTRAYLETVGKADQKRYRVLATEQTFEVSIFDQPDGPVYAGKIDGIWREKSSSRAIVVEHKFLRSWDPDLNLLALDMQVSFYTIGARAALGIDTSVTLYNVVRKPQHKPKAGETPEEFGQRMHDLAISESKEDPERWFMRRTVHRSNQQLATALEDLRTVTRKMESDPARYRNVSSDTCRMCSFVQICLNDDPGVTSELFVERPEQHPELAKP